MKNVPAHVTDPDAYHKFFSKWGDVVFVTIATDNGPLMKRLADLRELEQVIDAKVNTEALQQANGETVIHQSDLTDSQIAQQKFGLNATMESLEAEKEKIAKDIETLSKATYQVRNTKRAKSAPSAKCTKKTSIRALTQQQQPKTVFAIFNKEASQRQCLKDCATGVLEDMFNVQCFSTQQHSKMEGKVLKVIEPVEPSEVIYENLHVNYFDYWFGIIKSYSITCLLLYVSFIILSALTPSAAETANDSEIESETADSSSGGGSSFGAAIFVAMLNGGMPVFLKTLTLKTELHVDEGDLQTSILR